MANATERPRILRAGTHCHCGLLLVPHLSHADVLLCPHCDGACTAHACGRCRMYEIGARVTNEPIWDPSRLYAPAI